MQVTHRRARRRHSAALKAEILDACAQPGVSVAGVALAYGVNANMVHRWRREAKGDARGRRHSGELAQFVPLSVTAAPVMTAADDIRIELRRDACSITVAWPTSAAADCANWLRDWVR